MERVFPMHGLGRQDSTGPGFIKHGARCAVVTVLAEKGCSRRASQREKHTDRGFVPRRSCNPDATSQPKIPPGSPKSPLPCCSGEPIEMRSRWRCRSIGHRPSAPLCPQGTGRVALMKTPALRQKGSPCRVSPLCRVFVSKR